MIIVDRLHRILAMTSSSGGTFDLQKVLSLAGVSQVQKMRDDHDFVLFMILL